MPGQTLSLSQSQHLQMVLAPQLRQSLEMLQLPMMELRALVQQELEQNPTIEETPTRMEHIEVDSGTAPEEKHELDFKDEYEVLARLDSEWRDYFLQDIQHRPYTEESDEKRQFMLDSIQQRVSLQEHLIEQLHLTGLSDEDARLGELIIGSLNDEGYLTTPIEELAQAANLDAARLHDTLAIVQDFNPIGVAARDLRECLLLQLERLGHQHELATRIVEHHFDKLGARRYNDMANALNVPIEAIHAATALIASLNPKPGLAFSDETTAVVLPEVIVRKVEGKYLVFLNDDQLPHVRISHHYRTLMDNPETQDEVKDYIRERIRSGAFLIRSIEQRQQTIFRIATEIVAKQTDFLDQGVSMLKPMTMAEIATIVGVHETTVSRTVSGKYMQTPRGMFDMKYFFTPGIRTTDGTTLSNKTVRDIIDQMVTREDSQHPLSDQEIMESLTRQGIPVARRTIAKYRLMLRIPPSHLRRSR